MKKLLMVVIIVVLLCSLVATPVYAAKKDNPANDIPNNLYLYEKDANWDIVWGGAWGKMSWTSSGKVVFNGHGLTAGTDYTLVIYNGWPSVTPIGSDTANKGGNVHIAGSIAAGAYDKIWLVPSADLTGNALNKWAPSSASLWEHNAITIP